MQTQGIMSDDEGGVGEAAITMAIGIIVERVSQLPIEDQKDLHDLMKALEGERDPEELEAIRVAMREILDQNPRAASPMKLGERPAKLQRWVDYVAKKARQLRMGAGLTQNELAAKSGLPQSHISRIESAKLSPSQTTLMKIAKALNKPLSELDPSV